MSGPAATRLLHKHPRSREATSKWRSASYTGLLHLFCTGDLPPLCMWLWLHCQAEDINTFILFSVMTLRNSILCTVTWKLGRHEYMKEALKKAIMHTTLLHWVLTSSSLLGSKDSIVIKFLNIPVIPLQHRTNKLAFHYTAGSSWNW